MKNLLAACCVVTAGTCAVQAAEGETPPDKSQSRTPLTVYDATGKVVGRYEGGSAILNIDGIRVVVAVSKVVYDNAVVESTQLKWMKEEDSASYYPTSDCSGPTLITMGPPGARPVGYYRDSAGDMHLSIGAEGPSTTQLAYSMKYYGGCVTSDPGIPTRFPTQVEAWPTAKVVNLSRLYPEPLSVR